MRDELVLGALAEKIEDFDFPRRQVGSKGADLFDIDIRLAGEQIGHAARTWQTGRGSRRLQSPQQSRGKMFSPFHQEVDAGKKHVEPHIERQDAIDVQAFDQKVQKRVERARIVDQDADGRRRCIGLDTAKYPCNVPRVLSVEEHQSDIGGAMLEHVDSVVGDDDVMIGETALEHLCKALNQKIRFGHDEYKLLFTFSMTRS